MTQWLGAAAWIHSGRIKAISWKRSERTISDPQEGPGQAWNRVRSSTAEGWEKPLSPTASHEKECGVHPLALSGTRATCGGAGADFRIMGAMKHKTCADWCT